MQEIEFEINREAVKRYTMTNLLLLCAVATIFPTLLVFGISAIWVETFASDAIALLVGFFAACMFLGTASAGCFAFVLWLCPQQANNLRYRLEESTLRVDGGVFFLFRKSIPLERITDVALVQGPLLRCFDIWAMRIQTAGSPQAEATLWGVREPEKVRELILSRRKGTDGEKTEDA